jgi:nitrite reductase/ring-hydroxylating ferredoxin subunit
MNKGKYHWYKIFDSEAEIKLPANGIGVVEVNGKGICIAKFENQWYAFAFSCPHAGAPLNQACLDSKGNVICPVHNYKFSLRNGRDSNDEGYHLKTYPAELRNDGLFLGIKREGLFGWL